MSSKLSLIWGGEDLALKRSEERAQADMGASGCATPSCPLAKRHHDVFFVETSCMDNGITGVAA